VNGRQGAESSTISGQALKFGVIQVLIASFGFFTCGEDELRMLHLYACVCEQHFTAAAEFLASFRKTFM
jgi:hypothetical protein